MQYRRFGKTEFKIPVISCGGMRFQQSWKTGDPVPEDRQRDLEACIRKAMDLGITHIETARGYGTSEYQLGKILPQLPRDQILIQTKVGPMSDVKKFIDTFEQSMSLLQLDYIDIFSFHGINNAALLDDAMKCMDTALAWKKEGRIRDIGFSTHGLEADITAAINTGAFDHVNLHWYYFFQDNWPSLEAAARHDMGVFIISPNDKGGLLYRPSAKLVELTAPLHPMVFNGLFCLAHPEVHTLSCGVSRHQDFDIHVDTIAKLEHAWQHVRPIIKRLEDEMAKTLGDDWAATWHEGVPEWSAVPGGMNARWILRLRNLALAYDMIEYGKMRYNMLGNGGHWFPGGKAETFDKQALAAALNGAKHAAKIPAALEEAHALLKGDEKKRLQES